MFFILTYESGRIMPEKPKYEKDLYQPVKEFLEIRGWEVKGEVKDCDIAAIKDEVFLVCEMKLSLNLEVILQAVKRQKVADLVYIVAPSSRKMLKSRRWKDIFHLLRRLEIGLILVDAKQAGPYAEEVIQPKEFDRASSIRRSNKRKQIMINEFLKRSIDLNRGGVNKEKIITVYRETAIKLAYIMKNKGSISLKEAEEYSFDKKKIQRMLYDNYYGWFERISRGVYGLTERGNKEIEDFKHVVDKICKEPE